MKALSFIVFFIICQFDLMAQARNYINFDTINCKLNKQKVNPALAQDSRAIKEAEKYIISIVGKDVARKIWFDCFNSMKTVISRYSAKAQDFKKTGYDNAYELMFYVLDKERKIGQFELSVDSIGNLTKSEIGCITSNRPELIRGFKKHFDGSFKFNFSMALELGKQRGFEFEPILECDLKNEFKTMNSKKEWVGIRYYWRFQEIKHGGDTGILEVNTENGKIIKEEYIPGMPQ